VTPKEATILWLRWGLDLSDEHVAKLLGLSWQRRLVSAKKGLQEDPRGFARMSGFPFSAIHTEYTVEIEPRDGRRRWRFRGKVYLEIPLIETTAIEHSLMERGEWSVSRSRFDFEPGRKTRPTRALRDKTVPCP
jgi:hypothetical protein